MDMVNQILMNPVLISGIILTVFALIGRFFRVWVASIISCAIIGSIIIVILVTIGQLFDMDDKIRYVITSKYQFSGILTLTFGEILLILLLILAFLLALTGHLLDIEKTLQDRLQWFPRRSSHHYEMENTLRFFCKWKKDKR